MEKQKKQFKESENSNRPNQLTKKHSAPKLYDPKSLDLQSNRITSFEMLTPKQVKLSHTKSPQSTNPFDVSNKQYNANTVLDSKRDVRVPMNMILPRKSNMSG